MNLQHITDIELEDVDTKDYPDFCDAYIAYACYEGVPLNEKELEVLNENRDFVHQAVFDHFF